MSIAFTILIFLLLCSYCVDGLSFEVVCITFADQVLLLLRSPWYLAVSVADKTRPDCVRGDGSTRGASRLSEIGVLLAACSRLVLMSWWRIVSRMYFSRCSKEGPAWSPGKAAIESKKWAWPFSLGTLNRSFSPLISTILLMQYHWPSLYLYWIALLFERMGSAIRIRVWMKLIIDR